MAHSRKSKPNSLVSCTENVLRTRISSHNHLVVALSGGVDSVVLLNLLSTLSKQMQFTLSAIHVNHGISSNAALWGKFCCELCDAFRIPIMVTHLKIRKKPGISLEASARDERYQVFNHLKADYVVLAQHLDDQAETLLLQLLRGAGVKGLAAMPATRKQASNTAPQILRPLLAVSRSRIEEYARQHQLNWIIDESNDNIAFKRNFLRHKILPLLKKQYPAYQKTLLRTSRHLAEASNLLDELAEIDAENCIASGRLQVERLRKLSLPRAKNLLRHILSRKGIPLPGTVKLEEILRQILSSRIDTKFHVSFGNAEIRCYRSVLYILPKKILSDAAWQITWQGEKQLKLSNLNGSINFTHERKAGISLQKLMQNPVTIRLRMGGERFSPDCKRPRRSLKNLLQEAAVPPWERKVLPLLFSGEQLVWVPGIGVDCEFQAGPKESGLVPAWQPNQ